MKNVVIVGSGIAGLTCGIYLARAGYEVSLVTGDLIGGNTALATHIENYPGFPDGISGSLLMANTLAQAEKAGVNIINDTVVHVDFSTPTKRLVLEGGQTLCASKVVIATGTKHKKLGLPDEDKFLGKGIHYCAVCDGGFYDKKNVVGVVGGGETALQEALYLSKSVCAVHVFVRKDKCRASEAMVQKASAVDNIIFHYNTRVVELTGDYDEYLQFITVDEDGEIDERRMDALFIAVGHSPSTEVFEGHIPMDFGYVETVPTHPGIVGDGIFVAGSCDNLHYDQAVIAAGCGATTAMEIIMIDEMEGAACC